MEKSDFPFFCSLYSDPDVMRYTYYDVCDKTQARKIFDEIFEAQESTDYIVSLKETEEQIGTIFHGSLLDHPHGGIMYFGYLLSPEYW
jgi:RimJ/RimL family protein N-acetyltransferase